MTLKKLSSFAVAAAISSSALATTIVYENQILAEANWAYDSSAFDPVDNEQIGTFFYQDGPAVVEPGFDPNTAYRWTIDARLDTSYRATVPASSLRPPPVSIPGFNIPTTGTATIGGPSSGNVALSFVASVNEITGLLGSGPANLIALATSGLFGSFTLEELSSSLHGLDSGLGSLFAPPAALSIDPSKLILEGAFAPDFGAGIILLTEELPDIVEASGSATLDLFFFAETIDKPVKNVPEGGATGALALAGIGLILVARQRARASR